MMKKAIRILSFLGLIAALYWLYIAPEKLPPVSAIIAAVVALLASFINENKEKVKFQRNQSLMNKVRTRIQNESENIRKQATGYKKYSGALHKKAVEVDSWELLESDIQELVENRIFTWRSKKLIRYISIKDANKTLKALGVLQRKLSNKIIE